MSTTTISTTLTSEVTPGAGTYAPNILITGAGAINAPIAVYALSPATILNRGNILGLIDFQNTGELTNHGTISGPGISLHNGGDIQNTGEILAPLDLNNASLNNTGTITQTIAAAGAAFITNTGATRAITLTGAAALTNSGFITGGVASQASVNNESGAITGPATAVLLNAYGLVTNNALISGGDNGVILTAGGSVINAGTIAGGINAIFGTGYIYLTAQSGAAFRGNVIDSSGQGQLNLAGTGSLNIADFSGFNVINFTAPWTLSGGLAQLASGEAIRGFAPGSTLVLDGFAATAYSLTQTGVVLTNGASAETLALTNFSPDDSLILTLQGFYTTLTARIATIAAPVYTQVTLGAGNYDANLTIATTGAVQVPSGNAISATSPTRPLSLTNFGQITGSVAFNAPHASLDNQGTIAGAYGVSMLAGFLSNAGGIQATTVFGPNAGNGVYLGGGATLENTGSIHGPNRGINAVASRIDNTGAISGGIGVELNRATLHNAGSVSGYVGIFAYAGPVNTVSNTGDIFAAVYGAEFSVPFTLANAGQIYGGHTGVYIANRAGYGFTTAGGHSLINTGSIGGGRIGVELGYTIPGITAATYGENFLTNAGTLSGGAYAIENRTGTLFLTAGPGAVFAGAVADLQNNGDLILAGTTAATLNLGGSFSGFSTLAFATGATWTLEATAAELAAQQTITGFSPGDTLILDGFAAKQNTFIPATGLILSNPTATLTLAIGAQATVTSANGNTTIAATSLPVTISIITTTLAATVTPGSRYFTENLTIGPTGAINPGANGFAITADTGATVTNYGTLAIAGTQFVAAQLKGDSALLNAGVIDGADGIYLGAGASLINTGRILYSGPGTLGIGLQMRGAYLNNSGAIIETASVGMGVDALYGSTAENTGVIIGGQFGWVGNASTLYNSGAISSPSRAVQSNGMVINAGTLAGGQFAVYLYGAGQLTADPGAVFLGDVYDKSGDGVLILGGTTAATLDFSGGFSGFYTIDFLPGSTWTLEGIPLSGEDYIGITPADTLISGTHTYFPGLSISTINGFYYGIVTPGAGEFASDLTITNTGTVVFGPAFLGNYPTSVTVSAGATLTNFGIVKGNADLFGSGVILNQGNIGGVDLASGGTLINTGVISNTVRLSDGGTIINAGEIEGGEDIVIAIDDTGPLSLILEPGSDIAGAVYDGSGTGQLTLAGSSSGFMQIDGFSPTEEDIRGFSGITFAPGSTWTLEGDFSDPANGQTISGFAAADTIVLDRFTATSYSITPGIGLVLSNAYASETLSLATIIPGQAFTLTTDTLGNTTITDTIGIPGIVINTATTTGLIPSSGDSITITPSGTITTAGPAIYIASLALGVHILNDGALITPNTPLPAIDANGSFAVITNAGSINSQQAVYLSHNGTLLNSGNISGPTTNFGVRMVGSYLDNSGTIAAAQDGVIAFETAAVTNNGAISGGSFGIILNASTLNNSGTISSPLTAVDVQNYGVLINSGTISGTRYAIDAAGMFSLTAEPGAIFSGPVSDSDGTGLLILAGNTPASLDIAPNFSGFSTLAFAPGADWTLEGTATQLATGQTITGLTQADTIILDGVSASTYSYVTGAGLVLSNTDTLNITGSFSTSSFIITDNPDGNTLIELACFVRGTRILTPHGNISIEKLNIGDLVATMHGDQPIKWIGRRAYAARFIANNPDALPIRIRRHAIALNIPSRDLYVSPDHAIAEGGVLIHAHLLQNGISITQPETECDVEYFHLEFDTHTVIFAENLSTESFIDEGAKDRFQNSQTRPPSKPGHKPCLPRVFSGFHLHNITSRIATRAGISEPLTLGPLRGVIDEISQDLIRGWAQNSAAPEHPVALEIISGTQKCLVLANAYRPDLRTAGLGSGRHGFSLTLPNLTCPITIRRASDHAPLLPARHCDPGEGRGKQSRTGP